MMLCLLLLNAKRVRSESLSCEVTFAVMKCVLRSSLALTVPRPLVSSTVRSTERRVGL
jgi:hypothetical protein